MDTDKAPPRNTLHTLKEMNIFNGGWRLNTLKMGT